MSLADAVAATLLTVMLTLSILGVGQNTPPLTAINDALHQFNGDLQLAHDRLKDSPNGITLAVTPSLNSGSTIVGYYGRPEPGTTAPQTFLNDTLPAQIAVGNTNTFGLFFDTAGDVDYAANWVSWTPLANEPNACSGTTPVLGYVIGATIQTATLSCSSGVLNLP